MAQPILAVFGRWLSDLDWEHIPEASRQAARLQVLDMIAAGVAGRRASHTRSVATALSAWSAGGGSAHLVGSHERATPHDAAFANAAYSMAHDYDNIVWMGHPCHSAVFAALAMAEHTGADSRALLAAVVGANELAGRIGASCIFGPLNGQMWTFIHLVSAAAAAARLLRLGAAESTHALAIALAQPGFALQPGFMTPTSKLLAAATPTATGVQAAFLAQAGMTGAANIVEDPRGLWSRFSYLPLEAMVGGLGHFWVSQTLAIKTYPGCHYFQTACTAIDRLMARLAPTADDIAAVRIDTTKLALEATRFAGEYGGGHAITPVNVQFDLSVAAAVMLLAGRFGPAELEAHWLAQHDGEIRRLQQRIEVAHDPALTLQTLSSMAAVGAGRAALGAVGPGDVLRLMRRYRAEYHSVLLPAAEIARWVTALRRSGLRGLTKRRARSASGAMSLRFPNRVHIRLRSGTQDSEQIDLPEGSLCAASMPGALEAKVLRELRPTFGRAGAESVLDLGLRLGCDGPEGEPPLATFLAALEPPADPPQPPRPA